MSIEHIEIIIKVALAVGGFLVAAVPSLVALIKTYKAKKLAQADAAKEAAENEMTSEMYTLIEAAEELFSKLDSALKKDGASAGPLKKDNVLNKLRDYAESNGYVFDKDYWSEKIDETVAMTRLVNKTINPFVIKNQSTK